MIDTVFEFRFFFEGVHFNCEIRTSELAHPTPDTIVGASSEYFAISQLEHPLRAKCHAYIAALAVILSNDMEKFFLWFGHFFALVCVSPRSI